VAGTDSAGPVAPVPIILTIVLSTVLLGGFVLGAILNFFTPLPIWPGVWTRVFGVVPLAVGIWLLATARGAFIRHRTPTEPWERTVALVQDGPYRFSRNPIYLSIAAIFLGVSLIDNSVLLLIVLALDLILVDRIQIPREERYLQERFGEIYSQYKAKVRRWI
jgi:protein-S-isoprenylcysteine O-methyltransferase Ste14